MQASKTENIAAEQQLLGAILIDPSCKTQVDEIITPEHFSTAAHQEIHRAMGLCQNISVIDVCEILSQSGKNADWSYLAELQQSTPSSANVMSYARIVRDRATVRGILDKTQAIARLIDESTTETPSDLVSAAQSEILSLTSADDSNGLEGATECITRAASEWKRRMDLDGKLDGLSSGFRDLDTRVGGFKGGDLVVIAARPSMGKTAFAMQMVTSAAVDQGKRFAVFSLEMTTEQLMDRMMACVGRIPYSVLKNPTNESWSEYSAGVDLAVKAIKGSGIYIDDTPGLHINQICSRARREHARNGLDGVMVDHIGLVRSEGFSREREVAVITGKLKALAKELDCPVFALSQLNRKVEERPCKRPMMSDLRDSGSIEQDADSVLLLYREDYYTKLSGKTSINPQTLEVIAGKLRAGEVGTCYLEESLSKMRFMDKDLHWEPAQIDTSDLNGKRGGFQG